MERALEVFATTLIAGPRGEMPGENNIPQLLADFAAYRFKPYNKGINADKKTAPTLSSKTIQDLQSAAL
jgi:hypothetical protein